MADTASGTGKEAIEDAAATVRRISFPPGISPLGIEGSRIIAREVLAAAGHTAFPRLLEVADRLEQEANDYSVALHLPTWKPLRSHVESLLDTLREAVGTIRQNTVTPRHVAGNAAQRNASGNNSACEGSFTPEIGQALFGQPHQEFEVPDIMEAVLTLISDRLCTVMWNINQETYLSPFGNNGTDFKCDVFQAIAYDWSGDGQAHNFAWRELRISWYKRMGRGMSSNIRITPEMAAECLNDCLAELDRMDEESEKKLLEDEQP